MPLISALMPVHNVEKVVAETIRSILDQTCPDFELLIVDDGSTDGTAEVIRSFDDPRIVFFRFSENRGVGRASQYLLEKAAGRYIARVDGDDVYHADRFEKQVLFLERHPDVDVVKSLIDYFPDPGLRDQRRFENCKHVLEPVKNGVTTPDDIAKGLYGFMCVPHTSIMARAATVKRFGYRPYRCGEDYDLLYRMNKQGCRMDTVAERLVRVRVRDGSATDREKSALYEAVFQIKREELSLLFSAGDVYLWGAGSFGRLVASLLRKHGLNIAGFVDSDPAKQGQAVDGAPIVSPEALSPGDKVLIASQPGMMAIASHLEQRGFRHLSDYMIFY